MQTIEPVLEPDMFKAYYHYMTERHNIYKRKEAGEPKPWTDDPILQNNRFTCCKRYLDKTSKFLINSVSNHKTLPYNVKIWRTILFRLYNKIETMDAIGISSLVDILHLRAQEIIMDRIDQIEGDPFGRAYKIIAPKYAYRNINPKGYEYWKSSLYYKISQMYASWGGQVPPQIEESPQSCINWLKDNIKGVGDFIAYQIWVDFTYIKEYPFSDNDFTIAGPGCKAGIDLLCVTRMGLSYEEFLFWLRNNIEDLFRGYDPTYSSYKLFDDLPVEQRYWSLQDLENSFCEFSKYIYISEGSHKRPRKYDGI